MPSLSPEDRLKKLSKLASNTVCPNCGMYKKFGFSSVCVKFHTFVCNYCKTSHQAISHRCKSLTMSTWTHSEVDLLEAHGNDHARQTYLHHAPPPGQQGRPQPGDDVNVFKRFIVDAYERKRYYQEYQPSNATAATASTPAAVAPVAAPPVAATIKPPKRRVVKPLTAAPTTRPAPAPVSAPLPDLLDFSAPSTAPAPAPAASSNDFFQPNFGTVPAVAPAPAAPASSVPDPFAPVPVPKKQVMSSPPSTSLSNQRMDPFANMDALGAATTNGTAPAAAVPPTTMKKDPFADLTSPATTSTKPFTSTTTAQAPPTLGDLGKTANKPKKPIMGGVGNSNTFAISAMGGPGLVNQRMVTMNHNGGMMNNNNNNNNGMMKGGGNFMMSNGMMMNHNNGMMMNNNNNNNNNTMSYNSSGNMMMMNNGGGMMMNGMNPYQQQMQMQMMQQQMQMMSMNGQQQQNKYR